MYLFAFLSMLIANTLWYFYDYDDILMTFIC